MTPAEQAASFASYYLGLIREFPDDPNWPLALGVARRWQIAIGTTDQQLGENLLDIMAQQGDLGVQWAEMNQGIQDWLASNFK